MTTSQTTITFGTTVQLISDVTSEETSLGTTTTNVFTVSTEPAHFTFPTDDPATVITFSTDDGPSPFSTMPITTKPAYTTEAVTTQQSSESTFSTLPSTVHFTTPQSIFSSNLKYYSAF